MRVVFCNNRPLEMSTRVSYARVLEVASDLGSMVRAISLEPSINFSNFSNIINGTKRGLLIRLKKALVKK